MINFYMIVYVGILCLTRDSPWFDHDEFECIEHFKFLCLTILFDESDNATVCITVRMESTCLTSAFVQI